MGFCLSFFIRPPLKRVDGKLLYNGDWFPTVLALVLAILFFIVTSTEIIRDLFDLTILQRPLDYVIITAVVFVWALILQFTWQFFLFERFLHIDYAE